MFCGHCGNQISEDTRFCPACGKQVAPAQTPVSAPSSAGAVPTAAAVATAAAGVANMTEPASPSVDINSFKVSAENAVQGAPVSTPSAVDAGVYNNPTVQNATTGTPVTNPSAVDAGVYNNPTVQNATTGTPVTNPSAVDAGVYNNPTVQNTTNSTAATAPSGSSFAQVSFDSVASAIPKPKFRFKPFLFSGIAVVLVAAIVTGVVLIRKNKNKVEPSEAKAAAVALYDTLSENSTPAEKTKALSEVYGVLTADKATGSEAEVGLNISDEMIATLESLMASSGAQGFDMDWLKSLSVALKTNTVDNKNQIIATLYVAGDRLLDAEAVLDIQSNTMYVGVPTLSSTYISIPLDAFDSLMAFMEGYEEMDSLLSNPESYMVETIINSVLSDPEFRATLPTEEEFLDFLNRYADIIVNNLPFDSQNSTTITVGSIAEAVTEYTLNATEKDIQELTVAILTALKTDPMITGYMERMADYIEKTLSESMDNLATEYADAMDQAISEVQKEKATDKTLFTFTRYVDSENKIAGRKLIIENAVTEKERNPVVSDRNNNNTAASNKAKDMEIYHAIAKNAGNYESTFEVADEFRISGKGTISDNKKTGTYTISAGKGETFTYKLRDFIIDSRGINGSIIVDLPREATGELMDNEMFSSIVSGMDMGIELKFTSSDISFRLDVNLVSGNKTIFGVFFSNTLTSVSSIRIPSDTVSVDDIDSWVYTIDQDRLMSLMQKSPFKGILGAATNMNSMAQMDSYYG